MHLKWTANLFFLAILSWGMLAYGQSQLPRYGSDLQFNGLLGSQEQVELQLHYEDTVPFFSRTQGGCFTMLAECYLLETMQHLALKGEFCLDKHSFYLESGFLDGETHRFEGFWDPKTLSLVGFETTAHSNTKRDFKLESTEVGLKTTDAACFYTFIQDQMLGEPDVYGVAIDSARWYRGRGELFNFKRGWFGELEFLAATRMDYYSAYSSTMHSLSNGYIYQLLPSLDLPLIAVMQFETASQSYNEEEEDIADDLYSCSATLSVWQVGEEGFEDVTANYVPLDFDLSHPAPKGLGTCNAILLRNAVQFPDGMRLEWDGHRFLKR